MATDPQIPDFNPDEVRAGLRLAMQVGLPVNAPDQPKFYFPVVTTGDGAHSLDQAGVPFDPAYRPVRSVPATKQVPCAVEYKDTAGVMSGWGNTVPATIIVSLLDLDYAQVKGFAYVVVGGTKYTYRSTEIPKGLVSVGIYKCHCTTDDEA